ncbi:hypothetical protein [Mesobacillus maritimus]
MSETEKAFSPVDILVNNAMTSKIDSIEEISKEEY